MKIELNIPSDMRAAWDANKQELVITPIFYRGRQTRDLGFITVTGSAGATEKRTLVVNGKTGNISSEKRNTVVGAEFDDKPNRK